MIRLLGAGDGDLIGRIPSGTPNALRIRCLFCAYGTGYAFIRFYADETGRMAACVQEGLAVLWTAEDAGPELLAESAGFLSMAAGAVLSETALPMRRTAAGGSYRGLPQPARQEAVSTGLAEAGAVLSRVFPEAAGGEAYSRWYADLSHQIRHRTARVYVLEGACAAVCCAPAPEGPVWLSQLGTLPERRREGLAGRLLSHIAAEGRPILVQSQDMRSDGFYRGLGFARTGNWYQYQREDMRND